MNKHWPRNIVVVAVTLIIIARPALAAAASIGITGSVPSNVTPGQEFEVGVTFSITSGSLLSYSLPLNFDDTALELESVRGGSSQEFMAPLTEDVPFFTEVRVWDDNNYSLDCQTRSAILVYLKFKVKSTAPPGITTSVSLNPGVKLVDCTGQDISSQLPPWPWPSLDVQLAPLPVGASGISKFMDLDGDYMASESDAILMHKIVGLDVIQGETSLLQVNGRQADVRGNSLADTYDAGRMDALLRPARLINAGPNGICEYDVGFMGDDVAEAASGNGEPNAVVIDPGFNLILDTTPMGDDVIRGSEILSGPDGIADTQATGDDVQVIPWLQGFPYGLCVSPGPDQVISTFPFGDDVVVEDQKILPDLLARKPQKGVPATLKLIRPTQNPVLLTSLQNVPITVAVLDQNGRPKTGISPVFQIMSGNGFFQNGASGADILANIESDHFGQKRDAATGRVTVNFAPSLGTNQIQISLPGDPSLGLNALSPLDVTIIVDPAIGDKATTLTVSTPPSAYVGDTVQISLTLKNGNTAVAGKAGQILLFTNRNLQYGADFTGRVSGRPQSIFYDGFESGDLSGGSQGPWNVNPGGGQVYVAPDHAGNFGSFALEAMDSAGTPPALWRAINTAGYEHLNLSYQWSFIKNSTSPSFGVHFITQYSTDGLTWRSLRDATGSSDFLNGNGAWMYDSFDLESADNVENSTIYIRFVFDVGSLDGSPQTVYLDNVLLTGDHILYQEDFESYSRDQFPSSMDPMTFITTGPDGVRDTPSVLDDYTLMEVGSGQPYARIISSGPDGTLESVPAGDDEAMDALSLDAGTNGVADTLAAPTDFQEIPFGQGKAYTVAVLPGPNGVVDSVPEGDDQMVGAMGPNPRIVVDTTVYPDSGTGQGNKGSTNFLYIGRNLPGSTVQSYQVGLILDLAAYDQVTLSFYSQCPFQADAGSGATSGNPAQEFVVEVSDNGGKSWVTVWDNAGHNEATWTKHVISLGGDDRFNLRDNFLIRWRATMDNIESNPTDPDGVYLDDIKVTAAEPVPDVFSTVVDTMDGQGHYTATMSSVEPGDTIKVSALYWPENISFLAGILPVFGNPPADLRLLIHKADPSSIKVLPETFTLKACHSMDVMVVGSYLDTPPGQVVDMTHLFDLDVNGPARETAPGKITADCFTGDTVVPIKVVAVPKVPGLYDPGGGGGGQQTGDISGRIYKPNYTGAGNAPIWLDMGGGQKIYSHTDSNGFHFFDDVPVGTGYVLEASLQGYTKKVVTGVSVTAGGNTSKSFALLSGADFDADGQSDSVDTDKDDDSVPDSQEGNTTAQYDPDTDGDGYPDSVDAFPDDPSEHADNDGDEIGDNADTDDDNDGILDTEEVIPGTDGYITDPDLADTDGGGEEDGSEVTNGRDPTNPADDVVGSPDTDGDGITDANETLWGYSVSDPDTDGDGLCDGDTTVAPYCVAGEDMNTDGVLDASETDPTNPDTDGDGLNDGLEASHCVSGRNPDTDGDGLCDGDTTVYDGATVVCVKGEDVNANGSVDGTETNPCNADTDGDSIPDGYEAANGLDPLTNDAAGDLDGDGLDNLAEYADGTDPQDWDTDGDGLPDGFEAANPTYLDPLNSGDASNDDDGDLNSDLDEYWNGTDPWTVDPVPDPFFPSSPGCYYWGEGDGDGYPLANDKSILLSEVLGFSQPYSNVIPQGISDVQDLDSDGYILAGDLSILKSFIMNSLVGGVGSRAASLEEVYGPSGSVAVGSTTHVTVRVRNANVANKLYQAGFSVLFSVDASSTGSAVLMGGDGSYGAGTRFDVSGASGASDGGHANIVLKITGAGSIIVNAEIPACGTSGYGRYVGQIDLSPPVTITAE